ncbi:hypothetical protein HanXRQr2_Chr10g0424271 [Helianthus annuus]|uniref:Uncharacterized protein n=1 Tax=Helianthus annuus TaxID=4232 RepID=A0A251TGH5_HELAN|nr:uncharacterized protein LOC110884119 [Helianthus annuus]KAF5785071.1 hypothetical protein HanXRQr2_Chr10g0424271 [Helianthus annuus]KAJ0512672.1 hypothetical protein HanHA300_Chr10g0348811 [Helianthus annuus]KAJ0520275.1 hypothetical protein HanIR_Chr10g0457561 [Helianthus annuus]KAJ0528801.1 hypothetical protein HanHA89_Chr10g0370431 [Helianthus annuus]KAJ0695714.1 hypothetical protein HanLR1_Chr10g0348631 [Helianthus annuus]
MAAASIQSPSPDPKLKESSRIPGLSPTISPVSDKQFWSVLRNRIDTLLEKQKDQGLNYEGKNRAKRLKEDSLLLLRGFDSVASSLSQLSNNLDNALQGAKDLARPPTLSDVLHSSLQQAKTDQNLSNEEEEEDQNLDTNKRGTKRKLDPEESSEETRDNPKEFGKLNRAKNIAVSMAKRAGFLAREMKSMKSDLCFMQERCSILEEENRRLRDGFVKGVPPEEDDLVRLQLEALLAEKSRLANDNANLTRENQCLRQLVEYHQLTSRQEDDEEDPMEDDYERVIRGVCLDFSSPPPAIPEDLAGEEDDVGDGVLEPTKTRCLNDHYDEEGY